MLHYPPIYAHTSIIVSSLHLSQLKFCTKSLISDIALRMEPLLTVVEALSDHHHAVVFHHWWHQHDRFAYHVHQRTAASSDQIFYALNV